MAMKRNLIATFGMILGLAISMASEASASKKKLELEIEHANSSIGSSKNIYELLTEKSTWQTGTNRFAKIEIQFLKPQPLSRIEIESCERQFTEGVDLYVDFDRSHRFSEGGKKKIVYEIDEKKKPIPVGQIALNFRFNSDVCVRSLRFFKNQTAYSVLVPSLFDSGSESPMELFDGRIDTVFQTEKKQQLIFDGSEIKEKLKLVGLRVWNGDQRKGIDPVCAPALALKLVDGTRQETVSLSSSSSFQDLKLKETWVLNGLKIHSDSGDEDNQCLAEIKFVTDSGSAGVDVSKSITGQSSRVKEAFRLAELEGVVDQNLDLNDEDRIWQIRVRSNGSFFMRGHSNDFDLPKDFSYLANFRIVEANRRRVLIEAFGHRHSSPLELDGANCGSPCAGTLGTNTFFVRSRLSFGRGRDGSVFVREEGPKSGRGLNFESLKTQVSKSED